MAGGDAEPGDLERAVDELYAADPDGFTAARNRLASELRRAGRREEARHVAGLRRPTVAAWSVSQLGRHSPERIEALVAAGEGLRQAHEQVVSGGDPRAPQRAARERRALIAALAREAMEALERRGSGDPQAHREQIEATLEAASSDAEVAALVRGGRLTTAVSRPAGFVDLPMPATPRRPPEPRAPTAGPGDERRDGEERERAEEQAELLEELATEAAGEADRARLALDHAVAVVERLQGELAEARSAAAAAKEEAGRTRARADALRREAESARREATERRRAP